MFIDWDNVTNKFSIFSRTLFVCIALDLGSDILDYLVLKNVTSGLIVVAKRCSK